PYLEPARLQRPRTQTLSPRSRTFPRDFFGIFGYYSHDLEAELLRTIANAPVERRAITNLDCLNEAYDYPKPSSFSRGMRIDLNGLAILLISGTAGIDENGVSVHIGDFRAQLRRTYHNITGLLEAEGATWHDIVRTTCYLRDIERD